MEFKNPIHDFAVKWLNKFKDPDINYIFDTSVAGTSYIEGMEELEPFLKLGDKLDFFVSLIIIMTPMP